VAKTNASGGKHERLIFSGMPCYLLALTYGPEVDSLLLLSKQAVMKLYLGNSSPRLFVMQDLLGVAASKESQLLMQTERVTSHTRAVD
jgi:hypothetical protein